jgi:hypothetical protein
VARINPRALLELTDSVRYNLAEGQSLFIRLSALLDAIVQDEDGDGPKLDLQTIMDAHLEKLIDDLLKPCKRPLAARSRLVKIIEVAHEVQKLWTQRFKEYQSIDRLRTEMMLSTGHLRDVEFVNFDAKGAGV